jgi:hypothetical protein
MATTVPAAQAAVAAAEVRVRNALTNVTRLEAAQRAARTGSQRTLIGRQLAMARLELQNAQNALATARANLTRLQAAAAAAAAVVPAPSPAPVTGPQGLVRALCIGINYKSTAYELYGCVNDANNMAGQLRTFFPAAGEIRTLTDETATKPTKANILAAINWLVSGLVAGQNVVFHFAGHGGRVRDTNGDEVTGLDSCIFAMGMETITDDELRSLLAARIPAGCKCLALLDSCHSGTAVDLRYRWQAPSATQLTYTEAAAYPKTAGSVLFVSGCRDEEYAMDTVGKDDRPCGAMTMALLDTWRTYGAGIKLKYLLWDVRKYLKDNGYSQVPQLETGLFQDMNMVWNLNSAV